LDYSLSSTCPRRKKFLQRLSDRDIKRVAESLDLIIKSNVLGPYRSAAIELIGKGFSVWEKHLDATSIVKQLMLLAAPASVSSSGGNVITTQETVIAKISKATLLYVMESNPGVVMQTLLFELFYAKQVSDRIAILRVLSFFLNMVHLFKLANFG
jgi:hypothetical protein